MISKKFVVNFERVYDLICISDDQNRILETVFNIDGIQVLCF